MKTDAGEPPSSGRPDGLPASPPISEAIAYKHWRPSHVGASFEHAIDGVRETFRAERNFRFHVLAGLLVLSAGLLLHLSPLRIVAAFFSIALVMVTEIINTAIEATVDLAMPDHHPVAKRAKDASAGAVLVAAVCAAIVGGIVFIPALLPYLTRFSLVAFVLPGLALVVLFAAWWTRRNFNKPGSSLDLSRKVVIGVAWVVFGTACACRLGMSIWASSSNPATRNSSSLPHPALPFSAGVP